MRNPLIAIAAALIFGLGSPGRAGALTLSDLDGGASFMTDNLIFGDFEITVTGSLSTNLTDYAVIPLPGGFRIAGSIAVADGFVGDILIEYTVWAKNDQPINGAALSFNGAALGLGAAASVAERFFTEGGEALPPETSMFVSVTGGGGMDLFDDAVDLEPIFHLRVLKDINVTTVEGVSAAISQVDQTFTVVPEPGTIMLLACGLGVLARLGRKRTAAFDGGGGVDRIV